MITICDECDSTRECVSHIGDFGEELFICQACAEHWLICPHCGNLLAPEDAISPAGRDLFDDVDMCHEECAYPDLEWN